MQTPTERIRQRRAQMLVHSFLYYEAADTLVTDHVWQRWADELAVLQRDHPGPIGFYDDAFADWDGSTGFHLPKDDWVCEKAQQLRVIEHNQALAEAGRPAAPAPAAAPAKAKRKPKPPPPPPVRAEAPQASLF